MSSSGTNDIMEKFNALSLGEKIIVPAGIILFIAGFFPWYRVSFFGVSVSANAWEAPGAIWSILAILIGLAMVAIIGVKTFAGSDTLPDQVGGMTWPKIMLGMGAAAVVFIVIKFINESSSLSIGFYLGFVCAVALAAGGFLMFQEEQKGGVSLGGGSGGGGGSAPPPPPPPSG
jgi:hypothetical protein